MRKESSTKVPAHLISILSYSITVWPQAKHEPSLGLSCSRSCDSHHPSALCQWPPSQGPLSLPWWEIKHFHQRTSLHQKLPIGTCEMVLLGSWKPDSLSLFSSPHASILNENRNKIKGLTLSNIQMMVLLSSTSWRVNNIAGNKSAENPRPSCVRKEWGVSTSAGQLHETVEKEGGAL